MGIPISLNSCNTSSSFSQRKYRKGIFKESSVKISRDRTKQKEIYSTTKAETKPKEQIRIKKIKQNYCIQFCHFNVRRNLIKLFVIVFL